MNNDKPQFTSNLDKKAKSSLILGILGVLFFNLGNLIFYSLLGLYYIQIYRYHLPINRTISVILLIIGLILGIPGLKSSKKSFAIIGITICAVFLANIILSYIFAFTVRTAPSLFY